MKKATIQAMYKGADISRVAYTQQQANIIINQLAREGAINIACNFNDLDNLPKGSMII